MTSRAVPSEASSPATKISVLRKRRCEARPRMRVSVRHGRAQMPLDRGEPFLVEAQLRGGLPLTLLPDEFFDLLALVEDDRGERRGVRVSSRPWPLSPTRTSFGGGN
jgi:hypothetical protein